MNAIRALIIITALSAIFLTANWLADAPVQSCQEDMTCWDCETMGNLICGPIITGGK